MEFSTLCSFTDPLEALEHVSVDKGSIPQVPLWSLQEAELMFSKLFPRESLYSIFLIFSLYAFNLF